MEAYTFAVRNKSALCSEDLADLATAVANGDKGSLKLYWVTNMRIHRDMMLDSFLSGSDYDVVLAADWAFEVRDKKEDVARIKVFVADNKIYINEFIHRYNYDLITYSDELDSSKMTMEEFYSDLPDLYKIGVLI